MIDKLTKKRIRIDYLVIIGMLDLEREFLLFQKKKNRKISVNRMALAFLKHKKIDYEILYNQYYLKGIKTYDDYLAECCRIASDHSWIED